MPKNKPSREDLMAAIAALEQNIISIVESNWEGNVDKLINYEPQEGGFKGELESQKKKYRFSVKGKVLRVDAIE